KGEELKKKPVIDEADKKNPDSTKKPVKKTNKRKQSSKGDLFATESNDENPPKRQRKKVAKANAEEKKTSIDTSADTSTKKEGKKKGFIKTDKHLTSRKDTKNGRA